MGLPQKGKLIWERVELGFGPGPCGSPRRGRQGPGLGDRLDLEKTLDPCQRAGTPGAVR